MSLPVDAIAELLASLGGALARQRSVLEQGQLDQLASLNTELEGCYARIADFPGGQPALLELVAGESESRRSALRSLLLQLDTDNRVNGELIRITMHRVAAIQAFQAAGSDAGTYGPGSRPDVGSRLSRHA